MRRYIIIYYFRWLKILKDERLCDIIFTLENNQVRIPSLKAILKVQNEVLGEMINDCESNGDGRNIAINDLKGDTFQSFLYYLFGGKVLVTYIFRRLY